MKLRQGVYIGLPAQPAAFRRLCVETSEMFGAVESAVPAAFRRLCVETIPTDNRPNRSYPAAFRRLCVETRI